MTQTNSDTKKKTLYMTSAALLAALICVTIAFILHIPFGVNGAYIHVGDALIYLAASVLPLPYAMAAAAIGGAMADLLTAPAWAIFTFIIKALLTLPFTSKQDTIITKRNVIAIFVAFPISAIGYVLAEVILYGSWAILVPSVTSSLIQAVGSGIVYIVLGIALDKMNFKKRIF